MIIVYSMGYKELDVLIISNTLTTYKVTSMNIEKGKTYVCLNDLHSNVGPDHFAFLKGKEYKAEKDNASLVSINIC